MPLELKIFIAGHIINSILCLFVGLFVFFTYKKEAIHKVFILLFFTVFIISFGQGLHAYTRNINETYFYSRIIDLFGFWLTALYFHFIAIYIKQEKKIKQAKIFYLVNLIFVILIILFPDQWVGMPEQKLYFKYFGSNPGIIYYFYTAYFFFLAGYSFYLLLTNYKKLPENERNNTKYIFWGSFLAVIAGGTLYLMVYNISIDPIFSIFINIFPLFLGYAIYKHQLLNIKVIITRGIIQAIAIAGLILIFLSFITINNWLLEHVIYYRSWIMTIFGAFVAFMVGRYLIIKNNQLIEEQKVIKETLDDVKKAKEEIEKEKNKTYSILSNLVDPVIFIDNQWKISFINPATKKILNITENVIGKEIKSQENKFLLDDLSGIIRKKFKSEIIKSDKTGKPRVEEVIIYSNIEKKSRISPFGASVKQYSEGEMVFKVLTAEVCDKNKVCFGRMKIFHDLTREKMIDQLKSEFISIAAHQLRTPMSAVKWAIKMVLDGDAGKLNSEQTNVLAKGYASNERVITLINDMLNVSRIEEGRFGFTFDIENIDEILNEVLSGFHDRINNKHILLNYTKPKKIPLLSLDKSKIHIAFQHVIENAINYTPEYGKINIEIKIERKEVRIFIKDNGVGIPENEKRKLFTKFFRAENIVRMETDGSGLGLYIAKNIIEKHYGTIEINSKEGIGTEVIINLPIDYKNNLII